MNRRKIILIAAAAFLILFSSFLSYKIWSTAQAKENFNASIQHLPSVKFTKLDGSILQTDSLKNSKQLLLLNYFNPECDHCQSMVGEMFREWRFRTMLTHHSGLC